MTVFIGKAKQNTRKSKETITLCTREVSKSSSSLWLFLVLNIFISIENFSLKKKMKAREIVLLVRCLSYRKEKFSYVPSPASMFKEEGEKARHDGMVSTCNLSTGEAETDGSLGLSSQNFTRDLCIIRHGLTQKLGCGGHLTT